MDNLLIAAILGLLILIASMVSVELGVSVAIIEITFGVVAGNFLGVTTTPWIDFIAAVASIVLTFLAGAEVDPQVLRERAKESFLVGVLSFLLPFLGVGLFAYYVAGWDLRQAQIAGIALSTTSLAVVYAVLVETGLTKTEIGKVIMAATFITDLGTAIALSLLFIQPTPYLALFVGVSVVVIVLMTLLQRWFFDRYGGRVIEPEIKGVLFVLFLLMWTADLAKSHAVLPAFVLGFAVSGVFRRHPEQLKRFRIVAFSLLTPFFFFKGGPERQSRRPRGRVAAPGRLPLHEDRAEVRGCHAGRASLSTAPRDVHDASHEHRTDVRHDLVAVWPERRDHRPRAILGPRDDGDPLRDRSDRDRPALLLTTGARAHGRGGGEPRRRRGVRACASPLMRTRTQTIFAPSVFSSSRSASSCASSSNDVTPLRRTSTA